ncbi:DUF7693 family protein [Pseudomonas sp. DSP3-2-2]|uniref:DUF7693 family protein n=1 Tax=unclassified Pseudomonas TaxID=196821 RepID=UPI003CE6EC8F
MLGSQAWREISAGNMTVEVDGWVLVLFNSCDTLDYCDSCYSPDGGAGSYAEWRRYGTDPLELLSMWEHAQVERLLSDL